MGARVTNGIGELDSCVLGVIWREGPLSAYGVRTHFSTSPTGAWSSSSGSIYPSIRRLVAARLVKAGKPTDDRGTQRLAITANGLRRLHTWLSTVTPDLGTSTPDPLRTRAQFIGSLAPPKRARFLEQARHVTATALDRLETRIAAIASDPSQALEYIGLCGAAFELRGRLQWLALVSRTKL